MLRRRSVSKPSLCLAERIRKSYAPTEQVASMVSPRSGRRHLSGDRGKREVEKEDPADELCSQDQELGVARFLREMVPEGSHVGVLQQTDSRGDPAPSRMYDSGRRHVFSAASIAGKRPCRDDEASPILVAWS